MTCKQPDKLTWTTFLLRLTVDRMSISCCRWLNHCLLSVACRCGGSNSTASEWMRASKEHLLSCNTLVWSGSCVMETSCAGLAAAPHQLFYCDVVHAMLPAFVHLHTSDWGLRWSRS